LAVTASSRPNRNAPFGCRYVNNLTGGGEYIRTMIHASGDGTAIGYGDPVTITGAADTVEQYDVNDPIHGIALNYVALSTLGNVGVVFINHTSVFEVQEDSDAGDIAAASEGLNVNFATAPAANTTTGLSQFVLDSSTVATTASLNLKILAPSPRANNNAVQNYCVWLCSPNELHIADMKAGI
jgi:hypothetical protein